MPTSQAETLVTCTLCGQPGFTRRGLRFHWCNEGKNQKSRALTKEEWQAMVDGTPLPRPAAPSGPDSTGRKGGPAEKQAPAPGTLSKGARTLTLRDLDVLPAVPSAADDEWSQARRFAQAAEGFSQASVVAQIMCGFELIELQKRFGLGRGGDRKSKPNASVLKWEDVVKEKIGKSDDTARNWMNMARAVKPRLNKIEGGWEGPALLDLPPAQWPEGARDALTKTLRNVCEADTQAGWMEELGLIKRVDGRSKNPGGFRPSLTMLRGWLAQEYADHPDLATWLEAQFFELPEEAQERFRAEGKRYEERLTAAQKEELEAVALAQDWNAHAAQSLHDAQDALHYQRATDAQLAALETALADFLGEVRKTIRARAEKRPALKASKKALATAP